MTAAGVVSMSISVPGDDAVATSLFNDIVFQLKTKMQRLISPFTSNVHARASFVDFYKF